MHEKEAVHHLVDGDRARLDLAVHGIVLVALHEHVDRAIERRGEQQGLMRAPDMAEDPLDLGQEPHVGHAVGLVEHHARQRLERDGLAIEQVDEPSGCGDDDLGAVGDLARLPLQ